MPPNKLTGEVEPHKETISEASIELGATKTAYSCYFEVQLHKENFGLSRAENF
jgi:hypothetical protein